MVRHRGPGARESKRKEVTGTWSRGWTSVKRGMLAAGGSPRYVIRPTAGGKARGGARERGKGKRRGVSSLAGRSGGDAESAWRDQARGIGREQSRHVFSVRLQSLHKTAFGHGAVALFTEVMSCWGHRLWGRSVAWMVRETGTPTRPQMDRAAVPFLTPCSVVICEP